MACKGTNYLQEQQMKIGNFVLMHGEVLKFCLENCIKPRDCRHADLYKRYKEYRANGAKHRDAINILAEDYGYGHAKVERILARFRKEV